MPPPGKNVFTQAKLQQKKLTADDVSASEKFDNFKKKKMLDNAKAAAQQDPKDTGLRRELSQAVMLEMAYGAYREALRSLAAATKERPAEAAALETKIKSLRALKKSADEEVAAEAEQVGPQLMKLMQEANQALATLRRG